MFSVVGGMLAGSAVAALLHGLLSAEELRQWGWRLPFLGGLVIGLIGWWIRRVLPETPEFGHLVERGAVAAHPLRQALREMPIQTLQVGGMVLLLGVGIYTLFVWMPTYLTHLVKPPVPHALLINTLAMILLVAVMPIAGACADRFGSRRVLGAASLATAVVVYPLFVWIDTGALVGVIVAQIVFALLNGAVQGPMPAAMAELFPAHVRYSAMGIGYNVSLALFGGTAPLVATWLIHVSGRLATPALYLIVIALVTFGVTMTVKPHPEAVRTHP